MHACMEAHIREFIACVGGWVVRLSWVGWLAWFDWWGGWVGLGWLGWLLSVVALAWFGWVAWLGCACLHARMHANADT